MCAVPSLVPLQVIFTQNSAMKRDSSKLTKQQHVVHCEIIQYKNLIFDTEANIHKK